jgi:hypothetical protein
MERREEKLEKGQVFICTAGWKGERAGLRQKNLAPAGGFGGEENLRGFSVSLGSYGYEILPE